MGWRSTLVAILLLWFFGWVYTETESLLLSFLALLFGLGFFWVALIEDMVGSALDWMVYGIAGLCGVAGFVLAAMLGGPDMEASAHLAFGAVAGVAGISLGGWVVLFRFIRAMRRERREGEGRDGVHIIRRVTIWGRRRD